MKGSIIIRTTAAVIGLFGAAMAWQGVDLLFVGGTPYYAVAGFLIAISSIQLFRLQRNGFYLFLFVVLLTLAWAIYEAGIAFWLVGPRIYIIGLIGLWLCAPFNRRPLWQDEFRSVFTDRMFQVTLASSAAVLSAMTFNLLSADITPIANEANGQPQNEADWSAYGGSQAATRYAPLEQINVNNINQLERVWEATTGKDGRFSATPIQIGDGLFLCTAQNVMISLDVDTGQERWRFDPENEMPPWGIFGNCRGVTHYKLPDASPGEFCAERIFTATTDARMIAVDMETGRACPDFGDEGQISLLAGMGEVKQYFYLVTSPATVARGALVVGGMVLDNQETEAPSGVVRAYDPRTGALLWAWDVGREQLSTPPPEGGYYTRGTPNVWSIMAADDELGMVYVPTGNATPDYYGAHRSELMEQYTSSIVAIDAETGKTRWHFRTAHHDIWDYDVASQPTLYDFEVNGQMRKALIAPTKRGEIFVIDRVTGEPITEVTERPVAQTDLPTEWTSATQPFSTGMPSFAHPTISEVDMYGYTPFDQIACRKAFRELRWEGTMTPPSTQGTLLYPGPGGGMNWGSAAVDEERQLLIINAMHMPFAIKMVPKEEDENRTEGEGFAPAYGIGGPQRGTPFAAQVHMFASPLGTPCLKPPYGEIAVIDLTTQKTVWRRGTGLFEIGFPYAAGSMVTRGGLIFIGGVFGERFSAYDVNTGEVIWQDPIPASSNGTPMTYVSPKTGRQYIIATSPGEARGPLGGQDLEAPPPSNVVGGRIIAYALPASTR